VLGADAPFTVSVGEAVALGALSIVDATDKMPAVLRILG